MLKRLFGRKAPPTPAAPRPPAPQIEAARQAERDSFHLHLRGVSADVAAPLLRERYLLHAQPGTAAMLLSERDGWLTAHFPREVVAGVGFNREAAALSRALGCWLVGYRLFAGEGGDVHYFHAGEHVEQLAFTGEGVELEPESPAPFAPLADVSAVAPRPPTQHPLDFHHALLAALGIASGALTWQEALAAHEAGALGDSRLVNGGG